MMFSPRPDTQGVALAAIKKSKSQFKQVIAGTGWGKSLTGAWSVPDSAKVVMVCAPTIDLLGQLIGTYQSVLVGFKWFAMCSRSTQDEEAAEALPVPHSTSSPDLVKFLLGEGKRIVFSTYKSLPATVSAFKQAGVVIDHAILDEAHHLAGVGGKMKLLHEIPIKRGILMTATPKHVDFDPRTREAFSMDDPEAFGDRVYEMGFRDAVNAGVVVPFKVFVATAESPIDPKELDIDSRHRAFEKAVRKFKAETPVRKLLSKHANIEEARLFAEYLNSKGYFAVTISGETKIKDRRKIFDAVRTSKEIIVTYAECLNEGIDFPDVDGICFMTAVNSTRVIVQAVGRAVRLRDGKRHAYVLLPAFTHDGELYGSSYRHLGSTLTALAEADSALCQEIRAKKHKVGAPPPKSEWEKVSFEDDGDIMVGFTDIGEVSLTHLSKAISSKLKRGTTKFTISEAMERIIGLKGTDKEFVHMHDYVKRHAEVDNRFHADPRRAYKEKFVNFDFYLSLEKEKKFSFEEAIEFLRKTPHKLDSVRSYRDGWRGVNKKLESNPNVVYKGKGWKSWNHYLGKETGEYNLEEATRVVRKADFIGQSDYVKRRLEVDKKLPTVKRLIELGVVGLREWSVFLGITFSQDEAISFIKSIRGTDVEFTGWADYTKRAKSVDSRLPTRPDRAWGESFVGWETYLGIAIPTNDAGKKYWEDRRRIA